MSIARSCWEVYPKKPHDAAVKKWVTIIDEDGDDNDNDNNNHDKDDDQNDANDSDDHSHKDEDSWWREIEMLHFIFFYTKIYWLYLTNKCK